jgi:hypothetical protein
VEIIDNMRTQITRTLDVDDPFLRSLNNPIHLGWVVSLDELNRLEDEPWAIMRLMNDTNILIFSHSLKVDRYDKNEEMIDEE